MYGNKTPLVEGIAAEEAHAGDDILHVEAFATGALAPRFQVSGNK